MLTVFGTRPEAIKMAPVVKELERRAPRVKSVVCVTGQHRDLLQQALKPFDLLPQYDLDVMANDQTPSEVASAVMSGLERVLLGERPDWVLVQGDTTTTMTAALAGFYNGARVGHVEAGLRTFDKHHPFPEEGHRQVVSVVSDLHFAPTPRARDNLLREGVPANRVLVTGNPVIDALHIAADLPCDLDNGLLRGVPAGKRLILVTAHRRENFGAPIESICRAIKDLVGRFQDVHFLYSLHPNAQARDPVVRLLTDTPGVTLSEPLDYLTLVHVLRRCHLVLTDSGGIQEEAPALGKPVLVLRDETERPEAIEAGTARLIGTDSAIIVDDVSRLLSGTREYDEMARAINPYGDGHASPRIVSAILSSGER